MGKLHRYQVGHHFGMHGIGRKEVYPGRGKKKKEINKGIVVGSFAILYQCHNDSA